MRIYSSRSKPAAMKLLEKVPIFAGLSEPERKSLSRVAVEKSFAADASIVEQGENGVGFYLLTEGAAEVRRNRRLLKKLRPGDFFGEMALFEESPRNASVIAVGPARCLVFSRWDFWAVAMDKPAVLRGIVEELARRLGETDRALTD